MNSLEIQYFLTIVKHGSFTEAAQALSVSQPAISKQIRQLEAELGCSLFTRSGRALSLTEAGQAWYSWFQQCCFQFDLLKNRLNEQKTDNSITIRVAYPDDVDPSYFRDKMQDTAAAMETTVRLEFSCYPESILIEHLISGQLDLILTGERPDAMDLPFFGQPANFSLQNFQTDTVFHHSLSAQCFSEVPQILLYAASHPTAVDISEFRNDAFLFSEADPAVRATQNLYALFQRFGFAPKTRFAANLSTILDLTAQNEGVYLTHAWSRTCKNSDYQTLTLPATKYFYLVYAKNTAKAETSELCKMLDVNSPSGDKL